MPAGLFYSIGRFEELSYGIKKAGIKNLLFNLLY